MLMVQQTHTFWCWAAVAVSVDRLFVRTSTDLAQCELVERVLPGVSGCCGDPEPCDQPYSLKAALKEVGNLKGMRTGPVSFEKLKEEIAAGRPVCCRIQWVGQGGHAVAVDGCMEYASGEQMVHVVDPFYAWGPGGGAYMPYEELVSRYRSHGEWTHSYLVKE